MKQSLSSEKTDSRTKRTEMYIAILAALGESSADWDSKIPDYLNALTSEVVELKNEKANWRSDG